MAIMQARNVQAWIVSMSGSGDLIASKSEAPIPNSIKTGTTMRSRRIGFSVAVCKAAPLGQVFLVVVIRYALRMFFAFDIVSRAQ